MRWTTDKIRQSFLDFFRERGHQIVPSAPLVPKGDPTLLFTNAGMVPFKDYFLGIRQPPNPRVVDCQKCLRISGKHNDLEAVGRDTYHHTFFEMLGNWSFGDYYNVDGCSRFIELGNLVFIQYNRDASGALTPLPKKHVDTGTGLERVAAVMQSLETGKILGDYDIDLFQTIIKKIERVVKEVGNGRSYGENSDSDVSYRAIADHSRAISFLIAEGITPGNTDREYVLRRLIRRAARHGRYLGIHRPFLSTAHAGVVEAMGDAYPELKDAARKTAAIITQEESRFGETLDRGLELLNAEVNRLKTGYITPPVEGLLHSSVAKSAVRG